MKAAPRSGTIEARPAGGAPVGLLACLFAVVTTLTAAGNPAIARSAAAAEPLVIPTIALADGGTGLQAAIAGHRGLFLFDTGAGVTVVTPAAARLSGCRPWGRLTGFRATGQRLDTQRCDGLRLQIAGESFTSPIASVLDLAPLVGPGGPALSGLLALDAFANRAITIRPLAHEIVVETAASLTARTRSAREIAIRLVRDVEGVALSADAAVPTPSGQAWMELDVGNLGPILVGEHIAPLLKLAAGAAGRQTVHFSLSGGVPVQGPARVLNLIMDGDIGQSVLSHWDVTLDLAQGRAWFQPAFPEPTPGAPR